MDDHESLSKADVMKMITAAEANIHHLTSQIDEFILQRPKERSNLGRLWFTILPVGKLPTELLLEIFLLAIQSNSTRTVVDDSGPYGPPASVRQTLVLSQVCFSWRKIVIGSPKLWAGAFVDVRLGALPELLREKHIVRLKTLLERSHPLPISLSITSDYLPRSASFGDVATAVLEAVVLTASRWKDLTVRVDRSSLDDLIHMYPGPFAALETLDVHLNCLRVFYDSPRLRRLKLVAKDDDLWPEDVACMPFARPTHLNLVESNPTTCHRILLSSS
ncbi:hypothetical protein DFH08DRAFT_855682 [Mycena albidolilacea]|uniref:F-box domain-containing protein n=1 Tax=Mycena albidolilacea TaxID=1033008 RepID=A0AAD7EX51_9AGAR|nr:hypothetical protein DFH08DRAFT_855682 [Mycena albidolilacea]